MDDTTTTDDNGKELGELRAELRKLTALWERHAKSMTEMGAPGADVLRMCAEQVRRVNGT